MSKSRVLANLLAPTEPRGNAVLNRMEVHLVGKDVHETSLENSGEEDAWHVIADVIFNSLVDAQTYYTQTIALWTSGGLASDILIGSRVSQHVCPHPDNEPSYHCSEAIPAQYLEQVKT